MSGAELNIEKIQNHPMSPYFNNFNAKRDKTNKSR